MTRDNSAYKKNYGRVGRGPDFERCAKSVWHDHSRSSHQCSRKRGHGPGEAYCKQHDPVAIKAKEDARRAEWDRKAERRRVQRARALMQTDGYAKAVEFMQLISEGHNDPRALAAEWLADFATGEPES